MPIQAPYWRYGARIRTLSRRPGRFREAAGGSFGDQVDVSGGRAPVIIDEFMGWTPGTGTERGRTVQCWPVKISHLVRA